MATMAERHIVEGDPTLIEHPRMAVRLREHRSYQAFQVLRWGFTAAPIIAGFDKFTHYLVNWDLYLAPWVAQLSPIAAPTLMRTVGVIEIVAGLTVAFKPRYGGYIVSAWLMGIVVNLLTYPGFYDIALRDFGLALGAFALGRLAQNYDAD